MIQSVAIGIFLAAAALSWIAWRKIRVPPQAVFSRVRLGFMEVQRYAVAHMGENLVPIGPPGAVAPGGRFRVGDVVSFVYSVSKEEGMFVHLFSGKLHRWRPKGWLIACMLLSMLEFERELKAAGIESNNDMKQMAVPPTGTVFVRYVFTPEQHDRFMVAIASLSNVPKGIS